MGPVEEGRGHLTEEGRERFLVGGLGSARVRKLFRHLARGCERCRAVLVAEAPMERYDFAVAKAIAAARHGKRAG